MRIILNNEHLIVVDKPAFMLSVPGREYRYEKGTTPNRAQQWSNAVLALSQNQEKDPEVEAFKEVYDRLVKADLSVPRQRDKLCNYLLKICKLTDETAQEDVWQQLNKMDRKLNQFDISTLPEELVSAVDKVECIVGARVHHLHRLDQDTSGILMFAKSTEIAREMSRQFRDREVHKTYIARVYGKLNVSEGEVDVPLGRDPGNNPKQKVDFENGKDALTKFKVVAPGSELWEQYKDLFPEVSDAVETSLVQLHPVTGRTHQLRVHMLHLGHPMVGDSLYSANTAVDEAVGRLCLHAYRIEYFDPITKEASVLCTTG